jgi:drug/metabolite transporter (DMT)-like permease
MFLCVKLLHTDIFTLVFYRSLVQCIVSLILLYKKKLNPMGPPSALVRGQLLMRALAGTFAVACFFYGIELLPLGDAVTLQFTTPSFAAIAAVCIVGEQWHLIDRLGAVICLLGVALIAHPTFLFGNENFSTTDTMETGGSDSAENDNSLLWLQQAMALLVTTAGAASAGVAYVMVRVIGDSADAVVMVFYYAASSIPFCVIGSALWADSWQVWKLDNFEQKDYFLLILVGLAGYGGQWFTNLGLQKESAAAATLVTSTQIVWTYGFEELFLRESTNVWSITGTSIILGYMVVLGVYKMVQGQANTGGSTEEHESLLSDLEGQHTYQSQATSESNES